MSPHESEKDEHRQPGPGSTAQGGPRSAGDQGGPGGDPQETERERKEREREKKDTPSPDQPYPGQQAGSGAARSSH
jgi:hypothetical protein